MPAGAVYVGRPSIYCNPFWLDGFTGCGCMYVRSAARELVADAPTRWTRTDLIACYRAWVTEAPIPWPHGLVPDAVKGDRYQLPLPPTPLEIAAIRGADLACWCPLDQPCHADVLLEIANA